MRAPVNFSAQFEVCSSPEPEFDAEPHHHDRLDVEEDVARGDLVTLYRGEHAQRQTDEDDAEPEKRSVTETTSPGRVYRLHEHVVKDRDPPGPLQKIVDAALQSAVASIAPTSSVVQGPA